MKFAKSIIAIIVLSVAFSAAGAAEKAGLAPGRAQARPGAIFVYAS